MLAKMSCYRPRG